MATGEIRTLVIEKEFAHPPEKVWRALTQGALIKEWLMDNDFQPVVGHKFSFRATPVGTWSGVIESQVLVVEPNQKLSYSWGTLGVDTAVASACAPLRFLRFNCIPKSITLPCATEPTTGVVAATGDAVPSSRTDPAPPAAVAGRTLPRNMQPLAANANAVLLPSFMAALPPIEFLGARS